MTDAPDRDTFASVLEGIDEDLPPAVEVAERLADTLELSVSAAQDRVEAALDAGVLVEEDVGAFGGVRLADGVTKSDESLDTDEQRGERGDSGDPNPTPDAGEMPKNTPDEPVPPSIDSWAAAGFAEPETGTWPPAQIKRDAWMCRAESKAPYAPWADADAPIECNHPDHGEGSTCADCGHHAGYKWGSNGSREHVHADHATAREWADMDPSLSSDLVFIQRDDDPLAFVDGDDVRDPDTGDVHPAFIAMLEHLGVTYADISTSGSGVHAVYRGEIPLDGVPEATFDLDSEPFGANDDPPAIEIYDGKHVCIATGDHVGGTGTEATEWDDDALADILRANGYEEREQIGADSSVDFDDYEPKATDSDETTDDIRDVFRALDQLDPKRVGERTIVREWTRGRRSFLPTWGSSDDNGTANYIDDRIWHDTGRAGGYGPPRVMAAIDANLISHRGAEPSDVRGETFFKALDHLRGLGFSIPRYEPDKEGDGDTAEEDNSTDPRALLELDVVVEASQALAAAGAVVPDDLEEPLPELQRDDVDDVAIAVALAQDWVDAPDEFPDDGRYTDAYYLARDRYGAPLPKYLDNSALEHRTDLVYAALDRITEEHVLDACRSDITVEDPSGTAVAKLDPIWEDSDSGERILAGYGRGRNCFHCVKHGESLTALQFAALEHGLIETEAAYPHGETFKQAYRLLRQQYDAPLPKWRATLLEHTAVLPPATRLLDDASTDRSLKDAQKQTEALLRDAVNVHTHAQLITCLPGTGKTFGAAIVADDHPILYLAPRNDLKKQIEGYAAVIRRDDDIDAEPSVRHLPILAERQLDDEFLDAAVGAVRENDRQLLRDRRELLAAVGLLDDDGEVGTDAIDEEDDEDDDVNLDRATCPTADGEHGLGWALAVQTARRLGHDPAEIHQHAEALFGEGLPCTESGDCAYRVGWDEVRDPADQADILVGAPGHAGVDSATTHFSRSPDGERVEQPRAVVVDEFPGDEYTTHYGDRALDHATWLADALAGVSTREALLDADLDADTWTSLWLDGDGGEYAAAETALDAITDGRALLDARAAAKELLEANLDSLSTRLNVAVLRDTLQSLADGGDADLAALTDAQAAASDAADTAYASGDEDAAGSLYDIAAGLEAIVDGLERCPGGGAAVQDRIATATDELPVGGDLRALLDDVGRALAGDRPAALLDAAAAALRGGRDGCRELAIYAEDGYAHPDAWALLAGAITQDVPELSSGAFSFDETEGGRFKRVQKNDATIVQDLNHHGALVVDTPGFSDITGTKCPVLGLDATGRSTLWRHALGRDVERRDIHDSAGERRGFLRDMGHRVVQTTDRALPYHGDPTGKNFGEDLELVNTVAEEYTGPHAPLDDKGPLTISTKKMLDYLGDDLEGVAGARVNYENMKGSDELGNHQAAVILGSQHFGDAEPEKWALIAGESAAADRDKGRGADLDYGSDVANEYLRYMREDHVMQAVLRAGRNEEDTVVFAHTSALRDDLPVVAQAGVLSSYSKGTLAVVEAAAELDAETFTAADIVEAIADDDRGVGRRQVQTILADLREDGYLRVEAEPQPGVAGEYALEEDPGTADIDLPDVAVGDSGGSATNENSRMGTQYTWNFVSPTDADGQRWSTPPTRPTIPATNAAETVASGPPGG